MNSQPADPGACAYRIRFTASARAAWQLVLSSIPIPKGASILLPAYIGITDREGSGVFDPVVECDVPYTFYKVDERLRPDLGELEALLGTGRHPLLLLIHYFGMLATDMGRLKGLCQRHGVRLIEDCAHVPELWHSRDRNMGATGDAALYSLHKVLPMSGGGALRINSEAFKQLAAPDDSKASDCAALVARVDYPEVLRRRRSNYAWLAKRLEGIPAATILFPDIGDSAPLNFPLLVPAERREDIYFELRDAGFAPVALYYRLIEQISRDRFPVSHAISGSILNLPVHQEVSQPDLVRLADLLDAILRRPA